MRQMLNRIKEFFKSNYETEKDRAIRYLSESYDHVDLERRMKELDQRGVRWY
jgi:hypothetical protein